MQSLPDFIKPLLFLLWTGGTFFATSSHFVDAEVAAQWFWLLWGVVAWALWQAGKGFFHKPLAVFTPSHATAAISLCAGAMALYALLQKTGLCEGNNGFAVTGRFDNPAGLASCLTLSDPFCLYRLGQCGQKQRIGRGILLVGVAAAVAASGSRAGMAGLWAMGLTYVTLRLHGRHRTLLLAAGLAAGMAAGTWLYFHKKDSADGRLLIWRCTAEMIARRPLFGYGPGGFEANYMDFQANYFAQHPHSRFALLADDVKQPFNEYLGLWTNYGLPGFLLLPALWTGAVWCYRKRRNEAALCGLICLTGLAVMALFSYPLRYAHTFLLSGVAAGMLLRPVGMSDQRQGWMLPGKRRLMRIAVRTAACIAGIAIGARMKAEADWQQAARHAMEGRSAEAFAAYERLLKPLGRQPLFLYNYAAELNLAGRYAESLHMARQCEARFADYYTQLLLADNCMHLHRYDEAATHAARASLMCPGRLRPLRVQCEAEWLAGRHEAAKRTADEALRRPLKVESAETEQLRADLRRLLQAWEQAAAE